MLPLSLDGLAHYTLISFRLHYPLTTRRLGRGSGSDVTYGWHSTSGRTGNTMAAALLRYWQLTPKVHDTVLHGTRDTHPHGSDTDVYGDGKTEASVMPTP